MTKPIVIVESDEAKARQSVALFGSETDGAFSLRVQQSKPGEGTPLHTHDDQAETFHVISGRYRFRAGDEELVGEAGFTLHVPKRVPHCFVYEGKDVDGQIISIMTPGIHDGFIRDLPTAELKNTTPAELTEMAGQYGVTILGPGLMRTGE